MTAAKIDVDLDGTFAVGGKVHGGYLLATAIGAAMGRANLDLHPHPVAAAAVYAAPPNAGHAAVHVHALKAGKSIATYRLVVVQEDTELVEVLLTAGRLPEADAEPLLDLAGLEAASALPIDQCIDSPPPPGAPPVGVRRFINVRIDPSTAPWATGAPLPGTGEIRGWVQMAHPDWDPLLAQFILADSAPPATFDFGLFGWVPTLQLQVLLRRIPPAGQWQQLRQRALVVSGGFLDEDCALWDEAGNLTVQARQLAAYRA